MTLKNKIHLSLIIFLCLSIIIIIFLIYPLFTDIKKGSQDLLSQRKTLVSFEAKIENLGEFKIRYQEVEPSLEKIPQLFIDAEAPVEFIDFLEDEANLCQIPIEISSALPLQEKEDPWPSFSFQVTTISSFPQFLRFLEKLETGFYLIEIQNLNIKRLTEKELQTKDFESYRLGDVKTNLSFKVFSK